VWFPSEDTVVEPEAPLEDRTVYSNRAQKILKHLFLSKTVQTHSVSLSDYTPRFTCTLTRCIFPGDPAGDLHAMREEDPLREDGRKV